MRRCLLAAGMLVLVACGGEIGPLEATDGDGGVADGGTGSCTTGSAFDPAVEAVIDQVFGTYGAQAIQVARCESGAYGTSAVNGQYEGLFQMGSTERATYGDSACAEGQSQAAFAYFTDTGSDWRPWSCKPDAG